MWKCPDCNYIMEDQDSMCRNCGYKNPDEVIIHSPSTLAYILKGISMLIIILSVVATFTLESLLPFMAGMFNALIFYVLGYVVQRLRNLEAKLKKCNKD